MLGSIFVYLHRCSDHLTQKTNRPRVFSDFVIGQSTVVR